MTQENLLVKNTNKGGKLNYIHLNPVRAGLVEKEEEYLNSSCDDYYGSRVGLIVLDKWH
jgi:hypothetical protein